MLLKDIVLEFICQMSVLHFSNPNTTVHCIQDGSIEVERSHITDLVSQVVQLVYFKYVSTKVNKFKKNIVYADKLCKNYSSSLNIHIINCILKISVS